MMTFADLGMGNGLLNTIAAAYGRDDTQAIRRLVSSGVAALSVIAALALGLFAVSYHFLPWSRIFNVQSALARQEAGPSAAVFFLFFALALPVNVVQRVQTGLQQSFRASLWQCSGSVLSLAAVLLAIHLQAGLPWLVAALVGTSMIAALANNAVFFGRAMREVSPHWRFVSMEHSSQIAKVGAQFVILQLIVSACLGSDNLIIAQLLGASAVAVYAVPAKLFVLINGVIMIALGPLWPAYGEAIARGDFAWVRKTLRHSFLFSVAYAGVVAACIVVAGSWLIRLWVHGAVSPPVALLVAMGVWATIEAGGNAVGVFLNGAGILRPQIIFASVMGVVSLALKIFWVPRFGVAGICWATVVAYLLTTAAPAAYVVRRYLKSIRPLPA
jgi:O-antigen/teichoic acid export membrane protein